MKSMVLSADPQIFFRATYQHQVKVLTLQGSNKAQTQMSPHIKIKLWNQTNQKTKQKEALTTAGMLLHLLEGGISVRRSGLRLMFIEGLLSCMFLGALPGDSSPGEVQWLL